MTLNLARGLKLPLDYAVEKFAFLGRTGSGKTYAAGVFAEELLDADVQIVVLDPVHKWWALRLAANGKTPAYDIPVFGGAHGDMPLHKEAGAVIADVIVDEGISAVLDVSDFILSEQRRFVTEFSTRLLQRKKRAPSPIHVFFEEAQEFAPQRVMSDEARMVSVVQRLIKLGRNFGVGATLISQRAAAVNKDVLTQTEVLCVLQTTGPQDRKAVRDWIDHTGAEVSKEVVNKLPKLAPGQMYIWSPGHHLDKQVKFRRKRTFDASATPKVGKKHRTRKLGDVDVDKIKAAIEKAVGRQQDEDPKHLRRRIKELEKRLREKGNGKIETEVVVEETFVSVLDENDLDALHLQLHEAHELINHAKEEIVAVQTELSRAQVDMQKRVGKPLSSQSKLIASTAHRPRLAPSRKRADVTVDVGDIKIKKGARRMLAALVAFRDKGLTKLQLGTLVGMKHTGGTFNDYLGTLRRTDLVTVASGLIYPTAAGETFIGDQALDAPASTEEIVALWRPKFKAGARKIFDLLIEKHPRALTKPEIGDAVGNAYTGGTFNDYLGTLVRNGVVVKIDDGYAASEELFL